MKIKCKYCGRPNGQENDLCLSCGAPLPISVEFPVLSYKHQEPEYFLGVSGSFSSLDKWSLQLLENEQ